MINVIPMPKNFIKNTIDNKYRHGIGNWNFYIVLIGV